MIVDERINEDEDDKMFIKVTKYCSFSFLKKEKKDEACSIKG